jgi:ribonucleoside-diphosphate reductase alpha chain
MTKLTANALKVLKSRYLRRDERGEVIESADGLFRRVAHGVALAEDRFGPRSDRSRWEDAFFSLLDELEFLPNSPTLMNAGTPLGQLSACFVLPVEDSLEEIFDSLKLMALIQRSGGGTGFSFSHLRPKGDVVASTGGAASGPVSFMRIFDSATENIRQGGKRRGANMGVLRVDHPDIEEFIAAKRDQQSFQNFNLSVGATDEFMQAVADGGQLTLRDPRSGRSARAAPARSLWQQIVQAAWEEGDPGLLFLDAINRANPTPALGSIEATNPCGEVPLLPYEACNLGSINLARMLRREAAGPALDWDKFGRTIRIAVRFLDDVIEVGRWPSPEIAAAVKGNRKIGLGLMGFADLLLQLEIAYDSDAAVKLAGELAAFLSQESLAASVELAQQRGVFPNWERSVYAERGIRVRNATQTSIAPTGTISIIAGTSAGIEPLFAIAYRRQHVLEEQTLIELNPLFLQYVQEKGFNADELSRQVAAKGALAAVPGIPAKVKDVFRTALEISPNDHLRVQAAFQKHIDNAVSKTINLPNSADASEIAAVYHDAWRQGAKGITVYRYGSKRQQVLNLGVGESPEQHEHFARCDPHACRL